MKTPSEIVAERITTAMSDGQVLLPESTLGLAEKLAAGKLDSSHWITLFGLDEKYRNQHEGKTENY
jgi:hypothetical protein